MLNCTIFFGGVICTHLSDATRLPHAFFKSGEWYSESIAVLDAANNA